LDAGGIRRRAHRRLSLANGHGVVDRETQTDIVNGVAGSELAAVTAGGLGKRLCIDQPCLDFPEPVIAQEAVAFDRSLMHGAAPCAVTIVFLRHPSLSWFHSRSLAREHSLDS